MSEPNKPFVVTDRRKFTLDGAPRPDAERSEREPEALSIAPPVEQPAVPTPPAAAKPESSSAEQETQPEADLPALTAEQMEQSKRAYEATADRLETAIRSANPGMDHPPAMNFEQLVQSVYLTAIMQLGGGTPEGQQPQRRPAGRALSRSTCWAFWTPKGPPATCSDRRAGADPR